MPLESPRVQVGQCLQHTPWTYVLHGLRMFTQRAYYQTQLSNCIMKSSGEVTNINILQDHQLSCWSSQFNRLVSIQITIGKILSFDFHSINICYSELLISNQVLLSSTYHFMSTFICMMFILISVYDIGNTNKEMAGQRKLSFKLVLSSIGASASYYIDKKIVVFL